MRITHSAALAAVAMSILASVSGCGSSTEPTTPVVTASGRRLSVGEATVCALTSSDALQCWGQNDTHWQYGVSNTIDSSRDVPAPGPVPMLTSLNAGMSQHMCGLTSSHDAECWGRGQYGQLGGGSLGDLGNAETPVMGSVSWADIYVGRLLTCGLSTAGVGYCWGLNQHGEIGVDSILIGASYDIPLPIMGGHVFSAVVPGWLHTCGIVVGGQVFCWGSNTQGQLGIGSIDTVNHREPLPVIDSTDKFVQLSLGAMHTCGLTTDHRVLCWGSNGKGQLGDGTTTGRGTPAVVSGGHAFTFIATGSGFAGGTANASGYLTLGPSPVFAHTCALDAGGAAYCWGWNGNGQLGDGSTTDRLTPVTVAGGLQFSMLALGGTHTCGMRGNAVWCWGSNFYGQLGNGTKVDANAPVSVGAPFATP